MLFQTDLHVPGMDCPSEERLIRVALEPEESVRALRFDLDARRLFVWHDGPPEPLLARLEPLGFGARVLRTGEAARLPTTARDESSVLKVLLAINGSMFVLELVLGWIAESTGLLADAADMFADAAVYALSLYAVGRPGRQQRSAALSGVVQLLLALWVLVEVGRRAIFGSEPAGPLMMGVSALALAANVACVALLARHRTGGVHMKASWIFTTHDVLANLGVILAGVLVWWLDTPVPDLVIGAGIGLVVMSGAVRILRLSR